MQVREISRFLISSYSLSTKVALVHARCLWLQAVACAVDLEPRYFHHVLAETCRWPVLRFRSWNASARACGPCGVHAFHMRCTVSVRQWILSTITILLSRSARSCGHMPVAVRDVSILY